MKKLLLLFIFIFFYVEACFSQIDSLVKVDLLKAPASPASNLLEIAPSEINKPTDVANLMLNIQNIPSLISGKSGYGLDIAPYWLWGKNTKSLDNIIMDTTIDKVLPQTFVFSIAIKNTDSVSTSLPANSLFTSYGFKFSLLRGKTDERTKSIYKGIKLLHKKTIESLRMLDISKIDSSEDVKSTADSVRAMERMLKNDALSPAEKQKLVNSFAALKKRLDSLRSAKLSMVAELSIHENMIDAKIQNLKIVRFGLLWDFAGGTSIQFKNKMFTGSRIYNVGLWTVLGYATPKAGTPLLLLRYMYNPETDWLTTTGFKKTTDFSTFDAGLKYEYSPKDSRFNTSLEGIYRSFLSGSDLKATWKCVLNLDYAIWPNQHLVFSFGKDFDNQIIKQGNVIAAFSFLSGIGTKRKLN